ncbi:hypothetical protein NHX12_031490 [Muraenolepis orangiensis]|uniref:Uncharacterized protein n=1 Tax=Muraenolepis orangiensis TaxID=630683 RepID=A0A9Q0E5Q4_9TELE|nr:hypothetical protein NHX12_031490 [Muraenolepis orangiensis]
MTISSKEEQAMLPTVPGCPSGGSHTLKSNTCIEISNCHLVTATLCQDRHHRRLAICSIICGLTCIGITSLIYSAREELNQEKAQMFSKKAKKYGILSIVVWIIILVSLPCLVVLGSYLLTKIN